MNPILALLRRSGGGSGNQNSRDTRHQNSKKHQAINKSASSADNLDKTGGFEAQVALPVALGSNNRRGFSSLERPLETSEKKKSASESNLLSAASSGNADCDIIGSSVTPSAGEICARGNGISGLQGHNLPQNSEDFPAPPNAEELHRMSVSATLETVTGGEGFYRYVF